MTLGAAPRLLLASLLAGLAACGDNLPGEPLPDCSALAPPATGLGLPAAREAHRRAALRQRLRYREAIEPGHVLRATAPLVEQARIERGLVCPQDLYEVGRILFEHAYSFADGLGAGPSAAPFRRIQLGRHGGPETTSCTSCHWRNGPAGGGGVADAAFLYGDGASATSADARNPPALLGAGVVQALAQEMTAELAALRDGAVAQARRAKARVDVELTAKGISYGVLHVDAGGRIDTDDVRGIDPDLVVRPFGWKGTVATIDEFVAEAAALHFGIQGEDAASLGGAEPLELGDGAPEDRDGDGVADELSAGQLTALAAYVALLETPIMRVHERPVDRLDPAGPVEPYLVDEWAQGRVVFEDLGCATCHVPRLVLDRPTLVIGTAGRGATIDLTRDAEEPRLAHDPVGGGYPVFVFSDFKRHDLGDANASRHRQAGIATRFYLTRRLWGVGDSAPYLHDGLAVTLDDAIARHGGEAAAARAGWGALPAGDRSALRVFLTSLRRAPRLAVP